MLNNAYKVISILCLLFIFGPAIKIKGQNVDNIDPTVDQFNVIRGVGDPNYTGSLNISIPLLKVPGIQGLNYDISLKYIDGNGVPIAQSASWVGLGWNLENYEITCLPVNSSETMASPSMPYYYYQGSSGTDYVPDFYYLNSPEGTTQFWIDNNGNGIPVNWSAIKIKAVKDGNSKEYKYIIVYGLDGTKYVFAERLIKQPSPNVSLCNHDLIWGTSSSNQKQSYYYVYKLSAILANDYIDGGGLWYIPNDGGTDKGAWIKFIYSSPYIAGDNFNGYSYQQYNFLQQVKTPTFSAKFILSDVSSNWNTFILNASSGYSNMIPYLDSIELTNNNSTQVIKTVKFYQEHYFKWVYGAYDTYTFSDILGYYRNKLDSLKIIGSNNNSIPSYKFDYYDSLDPEILSGPCIDNWGYLCYINPGDYNFPTRYYTYGMLKQINYPTGGRDSLVYEPNYFQPERGSQRFNGDSSKATMGGGLRIKIQKIIDPHTNKAQIYQYQYGSTNNYMIQKYGQASYPGVGFCSADPGNTIDATPNLFTLGSNIKNEVHYPDVTTILPDGSKIIKFFTSACTEVKLASANDYRWMFFDDNNNSKINFTPPPAWPAFGSHAYSVNFLPYLMKYDNTRIVSLQSNDFPSISYPLPQNTYVRNGIYNYYPGIIENIALCESYELDDCNQYAYIYIAFPNSSLQYSGQGKIIGIDNSWKRGYPVKETKFSAAGNTVWSKDYYYDMILKKVQDYDVIVRYGSPGTIEFTACSGWVKLIKTVEKKYSTQ